MDDTGVLSRGCGRNPARVGFVRQVAKRLLPDVALDVALAMGSYKRAHSRYPNILFPKRFTEKVVCRSLFDHRPILRQFADKHAVRSYVEARLGSDVLPKHYHVTQTPGDIPFDSLPDRFVVKPTHGAGWVKIVKDKSELDRRALIEKCHFWLDQDFYRIHRERIYKGIPRRIVVEELIDDGCDGGATDYKFFVFHGKVRAVQMIAGRFGNFRIHHLDRDWNPLHFNFNYEPFAGCPSQPRHYREMVAAAEALGKGVDFVRVDLYDTPEKVFFGELTTTPSAGLDRFNPDRFDLEFGSFWENG